MTKHSDNLFYSIKGFKIPYVTTGTSPFIGAGQFGAKGKKWRRMFLNDSRAMIKILKASYQAGARGIEAIPLGGILKAAKKMKEIHTDYVIAGSTYTGRKSGINELIEAGARLIFVHGMVSDRKGEKLINLVEKINSRGILSGIATHDPINTINHVRENKVQISSFLIPFNATGKFMQDQERLEAIVDETREYSFIAMKTLAAGKIKPKDAFEYVGNHNIDGASIGMVTEKQARESTQIALKCLQKRKN